MNEDMRSPSAPGVLGEKYLVGRKSFKEWEIMLNDAVGRGGEQLSFRGGTDRTQHPTRLVGAYLVDR